MVVPECCQHFKLDRLLYTCSIHYGLFLAFGEDCVKVSRHLLLLSFEAYLEPGTQLSLKVVTLCPLVLKMS